MVKKYLGGLWAAVLWMFAGVASAQTTSPMTETTTTTTPGIPDTGVGDVVTNSVMLGAAALIAVGAAAYLYYTRNATG